MPSKRKFYKTIVQFEILSEEPVGSVDLETIAFMTNEGDWSGRFLETFEEEVDGPVMASLLLDQGSDSEFFGLTEDGEDLDSDEDDA